MDQEPTVVRTGGQGLADDTTRFGEETEPMVRDRSAPALARGSIIDRYVVTDQIGAGGMGVVYAAYDPELDRRVAIKLLRPSHVADGRPRLVREAQAIARIAHPNVVAVHDVGELDGSVWVAMEFIDGQTLSKWLRAKNRSISEIVEVFVQAGRGLAAAHRADLVHRDFKPDNVLVGFDRRVRVLDFGLARGRGSADSIGFQDGVMSASSLDEALTEVGTVMGTPAYMSPEQLAGRMATAQSDQFSYCVALFEAIHGLRPYEGNTMQSLTRSVMAGEVREPPPGRPAPAWLRRVVLRGLQTAPGDRYPNMEALLAELSVDRSRLRRRLVLAGTVGVGAVVVAGLAYRSGATQERSVCDAAADDLRAVWSDERRAALGAAFVAVDRPHAKDTWSRVSRQLDGYAQAWTEQSISACEATHVEQTQSAELLEHRRRCLGERLQRLDALLDVLDVPTPRLLDRAVQDVAGLPDLHGCNDVAALEAGVAPPEQESTRATVEALREQLAHIEALDSAARYREQLDLLEPLLEQARTTDYLPIIAEVEHTLARAQLSLELPEGIDTLRVSFRDAIAAGDDRRAAMAAVDLGHQLGAEQRRHAQGEEWLAIAQALVHRIGGAPRIEIGMTNSLAIIAVRQAHYDEAIALFEHLVDKQRELDPQSPNLAVGLMNLGSAYAERRDMDKADRYLAEAVELTERVLGPKHPSMTSLYANLSLIAVVQGEYEQAEPRLEQTIALQLEVLGPKNLQYARSLASMAVVKRNLGDPEQSERLHRKALAIRREGLGPDHPEIAESIRNLAQAVLDEGRLDEALELAREGQAIARRRLEASHPEHGSHTTLVARLLAQLGRSEEALTEAEQAITLLDARGRGPTASLEARGAKGRALRDLGRSEASRVTLEEAIELGEANDGSKAVMGPLHLELAQTLQSLGDPGRARREGERALQLLDEAGAGSRRDHERAVRWLAERGSPPPAR